MKFKNLIGEKFNNLTVIDNTNKKSKNGSYIWLCKCDCGNVVELDTSSLKRPERKSCGCLVKRNCYVGKKYNRLTIIEELQNTTKHGDRLCICCCECGIKKTLLLNSVIYGRTKSCGCLKRESSAKINNKHGKSKNNRIFRIWCGMRHRCKKSNDKNCKHYYDRNIRVCQEWENSYLAFDKWAIDNGYSDELSLDRINVDGDYEPSNCKWSTPREQCNNKTNTIYLTINDVKKSVSYWSDISGIKSATILARKRRGWSDYDAVFHQLVK